MKDLETSAIGLPGIINSAMEHGVDIQLIFQIYTWSPLVHRIQGIALVVRNP